MPEQPAPSPAARTFAYVSSAQGIVIYEVGDGGAIARVVDQRVGELPVVSVVVHPSGQFAYGVNYFNDSVSAYRVDRTTGMLDLIGSVATGSLPYSMKVHPTGKFGYVANLGSDSLSIYRIDDGALEASGTLEVGDGLIDVAIHPSGKYLYVHSEGLVSAYSIDVQDQNGALSFVGSLGIEQGSLRLAMAPAGNYLYVLDTVADKLFAHPIDATSGALGPAAHVVDPGRDMNSVVIHPTGRSLYVEHFPDAVSAYTIEADGALSFAGTMNTPASGPTFLTPDPAGHLMYMVHFDEGAISAYAVDQTTGALSNSTTIPMVWAGTRAWEITLARFQP